MKARLTHHLLAALLGVVFTAERAIHASPITYQGRLVESGVPASGIYDLMFSLHNAISKGYPVSSAIVQTDVEVNNGLFTVALDFGVGVFTGEPRWLEIGVRTNGAVTGFTLLRPRQEITSSPYANWTGS